MVMLYTIFNYQSRYFDLRHCDRFAWSTIIKRKLGLSRPLHIETIEIQEVNVVSKMISRRQEIVYITIRYNSK